MKDNVKPIWEDKENKYGGCWSFKIFDNEVSEMWQDLSTLLVTNVYFLLCSAWVHDAWSAALFMLGSSGSCCSARAFAALE